MRDPLFVAPLDSDDRIFGSVIRKAIGEPLPVLHIAWLDLRPSLGQLAMLEEACRDARQAMRRAVALDWSAEHPEYPAPMDHGGVCMSCSQPALSLFLLRVRHGDDVDYVEACGGCAGVPVQEVIKLEPGPDAYLPADYRADQHDSGLDDREVA